MRNRSVLRSDVAAEIEHHLVDITPSPTFRWIVALDDGMTGGMEVCRSVAAGRLVAAPNMTTGPTNSKMHPMRTGFQAFLASAGARRDRADALQM